MPRRTLTGLAVAVGVTSLAASSSPAAARSCSDLRALCWTLRTDKSDCTMPYRRCLQTGVFITPLGRRFIATTR